MTITTLPAAPSRADPTNFATKADALLGALAGFVTETNATGVNVDTKSTNVDTKNDNVNTKSANVDTKDANVTTNTGLALSYKNSAESSFNTFNNKYLGGKASDPTLDNSGNALQDGAIYISTVSGLLRGFTTSSGWVQGISAVAGVSSVNGLTGAVTGITTLTGTQTLTNKTITETVFAVTGTTPALLATNGAVQTWTLTAASTPTNSLTSGQSIILVITPGSFAITWPAATVWTKIGGGGALPTLFSAGKTTVVLWMVGSTLYGSHLGDTA
jgi:hypothetical protein